MTTRWSREVIHMATAMMWAQRSLCKRRNSKHGAVITTGDKRLVLSIGYNGPARGLPHDSCRNIPRKCGCLHAEDNAIAFVDSTIPDKVMFLTANPCEMCAQRIIQARITVLFYHHEYPVGGGLDLLRIANVRVEKMVIPQEFWKDVSLYSTLSATG